MIVVSSTGRYHVGARVAETGIYRLYLCKQEGTERQCLLQIALDVANNGSLDRATYILERLLIESNEVEREYEKVRDNPNHFLNYQLSFPELIDSFVSADQGGRRINILGFRGVEDVSSMVPLGNLVSKDRLRVDIRSSVWIMGKLLKILTLAHRANVAVNDLGTGNVLIEPEQHYVVIFSWASAQLTAHGITRLAIREDVRKAAQCVIEVLNGTLEGGIPDDGSAEHAPYQAHLLRLAKDGENDAVQAHQEFYYLVDRLWPRGFHKFTTLPRR